MSRETAQRSVFLSQTELRELASQNRALFAAIDTLLSDQAFTSTETDAAAQALAPLLDHCAQTIRSRAELANFKYPDAIARSFCRVQRDRISHYLAPALAHEVNLYRLRSRTSAPDEQYRAFAETLSAPTHRAAFWRKYPVLCRLSALGISLATEAALDLIERVSTDASLLAAEFGFDVRSPFAVRWSTGDAHNHGRSVCLLTSPTTTIVYKPRPMCAERLFEELVTGVTKDVRLDGLGVPRHLARETYGYVEHIAYAPPSHDDLPAFYRNAGQLFAFAFAIGLSDLHHENVIATHQRPVVVDVETLLSRLIRYDPAEGPYRRAAAHAFELSGFAIGLLPSVALGPNGIFDVSALGALSAQPAPFDLLVPAASGRSDMRLRPAAATIPRALNAPPINESKERLAPFAPFAVEGFCAARKQILACKAALKTVINSETGRRLRVRTVLRPTFRYAQLLRHVTHPAYANSMIAAENFLREALKVETTSGPLSAATDAEVESLLRLDIPCFDDGGAGNEDGVHFYESRVDAFEGRMKCLERHMPFHTRAIRSAFSSTAELSTAPPKRISDTRSPRRLPEAPPLMTLASECATLILDETAWVDAMPFSIVMSPLELHRYGASVSGGDLYDGALGAGVFMAALARVTANSAFERFARGALKLADAIINERAWPNACGAFSGAASIFYGRELIAQYLGEPPANPDSRILAALSEVIGEDRYADIVSGSAGALLVALRLVRLQPNFDWRQIARLAAERLKRMAIPTDVGLVWKTLQPFEPGLGGLAHGASGIAWALAEFGAAFNDETATTMAGAAWAYENSLYDEQERQWRDVRHNSFSCAWCYGAPGIGLAALLLKPTLGSSATSGAIRRAVDATWLEGCTANDCLCHGNFGNIELFRAAGDCHKADALLSQTIARRLGLGDWTYQLPGDAKTHGLMCGTAGIGIGLLRAIDPALAPNVLILDFPLARRAST